MRSLLFQLFLAGTINAACTPRSSSPSQSVSSPKCKAIPNTSNWPTAEEWSQLNATLDGRLITPSPPGAVCHKTQATYDSGACPIIREQWSRDLFHAEDPISSMWNNWSNDTCLPEPLLGCGAEGYPVFVINATKIEHVQAGVDFARKNNIRLILKNTGHDYLGRSSGGLSLSIWLHYLKGSTFNEGPFSPENCDVSIDGPSITTYAGTQMEEAYAFTATKNHTVVGGNGRTVGIGGFITGGGHSLLAPTYGLATDQVLEMTVVTAGGEVLVLNECQNTDLFWAMRGGGGGTFAVLISVTLKVYPSPKTIGVDFSISANATNPLAWDMIAHVVSNFPKLADAGLSGYPILGDSQRDPLAASPFTSPLVTGVLGKFVMLADEISDLMDVLEPVFDEVDDIWPGQFRFYSRYTKFDSFYGWFQDNFDATDVGYGNILASRLLSEESLSSDLNATKAALKTFTGGGLSTVFLVSGKGVHEAKPRGGSNSVLPGWRKAYVHAAVSVRIAIGQIPQLRAEAITKANAYVDGLRKLSPDTGAYMNEANAFEPGNWQETFWGDNYDRLLEIKRKVDPNDVFWCHPCVGNERWALNTEGQLCRLDEELEEESGSTELGGEE